LQAYLKKILPKVVRAMPGVEIVKLGMETDHLHMVAVIPPKYSVSAVIGRLKGKTASLLRAKFL
jgi:putative transposase